MTTIYRQMNVLFCKNDAFAIHKRCKPRVCVSIASKIDDLDKFDSVWKLSNPFGRILVYISRLPFSRLRPRSIRNQFAPSFPYLSRVAKARKLATRVSPKRDRLSMIRENDINSNLCCICYLKKKIREISTEIDLSISVTNIFLIFVFKLARVGPSRSISHDIVFGRFAPHKPARLP